MAAMSPWTIDRLILHCTMENNSINCFSMLLVYSLLKNETLVRFRILEIYDGHYPWGDTTPQPAPSNN